jgi:diguanylate cyclase (GGDEF)-like protein
MKDDRIAELRFWTQPDDANRHTMRVSIQMAAVLVVEVDDIEHVPVHHGERVAAELIAVVAERLAAVRGTHAFHLGDDMFVVVTGPLRSRFDALAVARRVQRHIARPAEADEYEGGLSASIGIRVAADRITDTAELVLDAAFALDEAKRRGRGEAVLYTEQLRIRSRRRHAEAPASPSTS